MSVKKLVTLVLVTSTFVLTFSPVFIFAQEISDEYNSPYVDRYISDKNMERVDKTIEVAVSPSAAYSVLFFFLLMFLTVCYFAVIGILVMIFVGN